MMYKLNTTRSQRLYYAIKQAKEGAAAAEVPAHIHALSGGRYLVNSKPQHEGQKCFYTALPIERGQHETSCDSSADQKLSHS